MTLNILWFALGLVGLYFGAEWLVGGAAHIARTFGVSPVVVGLTIVALGTSAPELVVSALAAFRGQSDVALGNVVGSNIMNIGLILGISAVIAPIRVDQSFIRREIPIMIMVAALLPILAWDHVIGRGNGLLLLAAFIAFTISAVYVGRKAPSQDQKEYRQFEEVRGFEPPPEENVWIDVLLVIGGIAVLVVSAHLLVTSAVFFAGVFGISELVVGLTIVAIGTSLPELATSVVAARRSEAEIALGNVVGSNICNILLILGVSGLIRPITVAPSLMRFEIPVSIAISVALVPLAYPKARLNRTAGIMLLITYIAFTIAVVVNARG